MSSKHSGLRIELKEKFFWGIAHYKKHSLSLLLFLMSSVLSEFQRQHENTLREMKALQTSRFELEQHVDALVREREMIKKQLNAARQARPEEIKVRRKDNLLTLSPLSIYGCAIASPLAIFEREVTSLL